jgi:aryl-alcohol dehydrogenase-like predicted oxidoreductase
LLTGKYRLGQPPPEGTRITAGWGKDLLTEENLAKVERLISFAEPRRHTILELAFAWLLAHRPVASVIAGATKPQQVRANAAAAGWHLSAVDVAEIASLL